MSSAPHRRTCDQLGPCQGRKWPCLDCPSADAPDSTLEDEATPSPFEAMWAWIITAAIAICAVAGVGMLAGVIVAVYSRWVV